MINDENISIKKIAFLKLYDVKVSLDFFQHMSISEISK